MSKDIMFSRPLSKSLNVIAKPSQSTSLNPLLSTSTAAPAASTPERHVEDMSVVTQKPQSVEHTHKKSEFDQNVLTFLAFGGVLFDGVKALSTWALLKSMEVSESSRTQATEQLSQVHFKMLIKYQYP